jgi:tripartite-type tricarboxylate transporter receptor subunit TctC
MTKLYWPTDRRAFLKGTVAAGAAAALPFGSALGAGFPERNMQIYVPTREGGGADRNQRAFTGVWKKYLNAEFEASFYPGAAGRVGYEKYMGLAKPDCHELIFGNMGPEVLNWVVEPPTFDLNDFMYIARVDQDPGIVFVKRDGPLQTIDDIVAEGKKRTLNVGVSRLAHPATLGILALGRHTGASFNPIPLSGGKNTRAGVETGEMDLAALPAGGIVKKEAIDKYPDRFKILTETLLKVFDDPDYKEAIVKTKAPWEFIGYGNADECAAYAKAMTDIGKDYKDLLTGKG